MKNLLVATDFSVVTAKLLKQAVKLAQPFQAKIWLVHVAAPDPEFVGYGVGPQYIRDARAETLREEHRLLQEFARQYSSGETVAIEPILIQGPTSETLLAEAHKLKADLIVLGSHGHGAVYELLVGSVCNDLLRKSEVPLLIIPAKE